MSNEINTSRETNIYIFEYQYADIFVNLEPNKGLRKTLKIYPLIPARNFKNSNKCNYQLR